MSLLVKKLHPDAIVLKCQNPGDVGYDLYSLYDYVLEPMSYNNLISTGIAIEIIQPNEHIYYAKIESRSSMAINGITAEGGIIDAGYRGEINVILHNRTNESYTIKAGAKIAQLIPMIALSLNVIEVDELSKTIRGDAGFGSTGK